MGLKIVLRNEKGKVLDSVTDPKNLLHKLLPNFEDQSYICLKFIDWYGDTTFNKLQMSIFLAEWSRIIEKADTEESRKMVLHIYQFALQCQTGIHLYLTFYGD